MHIDVHKSDGRGNIITLLKPIKIKFRGKDFVVPAGFQSDGVSVPPFAWPLITSQVDPESLRAGVAHDWIYRTQSAGWTRAEADLMFLCFLIEDGLSVPRALTAYVFVRGFGGKAWKDNANLLKGKATP